MRCNDDWVTGKWGSMSEYSVGICVEDIIEAEDELDAITKFFESLSWKQCYVSEIKPQVESEE